MTSRPLGRRAGRRLGESAVWRATAARIAPRERLTPFQFGAKYRVYTKEGRSSRWRPEETPWAKGILDALSDESPYQRVVGPKGTQLGWTEIGLIWIGQGMMEGQSALCILPTENMAKRTVRQKVRPMIQTTAPLRDVFKGRSADSTLHFSSADVDVMFGGSNSPTNFASVTVPRFFGDEVDRWAAELLKEGDPLDLAANRIAEYGFLGKMFLPCSPTIEGASLVWAAWLESNQQFFFTPCPGCGEKQNWLWENFEWTPGEPHTIRLYCRGPKGCGAGHTEAEWKACWGAGEWQATCLNPIRKDTAGFQLSSLYARLGQRTWASIAQTYEAVAASGSLARQQVFANTILGLPFKISEDAPRAEDLRRRLEPDLVRGVVPEGGLVLTCFVDYQRNRLEAFVWAHARRGERWLVDKIEIPRLDKDGKKRPAEALAADLRAEVQDKAWPHAEGGHLFVELTLHDSGDGPADVFDVLDHLPATSNLATKGDDGWGKVNRFEPPKIVDVKRDGKVVKSGRRLMRIHTAEAKRDFYDDLARPLAEAGPSERYVHLGGWVDEEEGLLEQFVAEEIRKSTRGKPYWHKVRERNEGLDAAVGAMAAYWQLKCHRWKEWQWAERQGLVANALLFQPPPEPDPAPTEDEPDGGGWIPDKKGWL